MSPSTSEIEQGTIETRIPVRLHQGPGAFRGALADAIDDGRVRQVARGGRFAPGEGDA